MSLGTLGTHEQLRDFWGDIEGLLTSFHLKLEISSSLHWGSQGWEGKVVLGFAEFENHCSWPTALFYKEEFEFRKYSVISLSSHCQNKTKARTPVPSQTPTEALPQATMLFPCKKLHHFSSFVVTLTQMHFDYVCTWLKWPYISILKVFLLFPKID